MKVWLTLGKQKKGIKKLKKLKNRQLNIQYCLIYPILIINWQISANIQCGTNVLCIHNYDCLWCQKSWHNKMLSIKSESTVDAFIARVVKNVASLNSAMCITIQLRITNSYRQGNSLISVTHLDEQNVLDVCLSPEAE